MRPHPRLLAILAATVAAGCGSGSDTTPGTTTTTTTTTTVPAQQPAVVSIIADANRDGVVSADDPGDRDHKIGWSTTHGASFLANVDDDDDDGVRDADDDVLNGDKDLEDLARIAVVPWVEAPEGATGKLTVDAASLDAVRLWKKGLDGTWALIAGSVGKCAGSADCQLVGEATLGTDEVRAGVELGVEGRRFRMSKDEAWSGEVSFTYRVLDRDDPTAKAFPSAEHEDGLDTLQMRVAPWVLVGNLSPVDTVWGVDDSPELVAGVKAATQAAGVTWRPITNYHDQWTQDYFQTAWTAIPGPAGTVRGMRVANPRPWGSDDTSVGRPVNWLKKTYLGPDRGLVVIYKVQDSGSTYDSHGNHELLPPYQGKDRKWPLGRIITGSGVLPETWDFYDAQVQGPHFQLDSEWLWVGHIDEFLSFVPASTPRGWKLLVASPRRMRQMLLDAQAAGHGGVHLFVGKKRYVGEGNNMVSAEVSIDDVLADADLMQSADEAQAHIDQNVALLGAEVGLTPDDIVELPTFYEDYTGYKIAWNPGTVNLLAFNGHLVHPDPFGPQIGGVDIMKQDLVDRLGGAAHQLGKDGQGLKVFFADDWYLYHILDGEVHCGTNIEAAAPFSDVRWWEVAQ